MPHGLISFHWITNRETDIGRGVRDHTTIIIGGMRGYRAIGIADIIAIGVSVAVVVTVATVVITNIINVIILIVRIRSRRCISRGRS